MNEAQILSIQVGKPAEHGADSISDKPWQSGIFKATITGRIWLDEKNLAGDGQDDLKNHGGKYRAVLAYSADHYPIWHAELGVELAYGAFGENFTVRGLDETSVCLGDVIAVGAVRLQVAQPRLPCWKLARRNGIKDLADRVDKTNRGGWYHRVLQTGYVQAGDAYAIIERPYPDFSIARVVDLIHDREVNAEAWRRLGSLEVLTPRWRQRFNGKADTAEAR
ncbi:MAG: MOSC domain-containing protein [Anaerolineae bacterium]|nr:MOSC domain-containing protein [Anaerolineae bacterium]